MKKKSESEKLQECYFVGARLSAAWPDRAECGLSHSKGLCGPVWFARIAVMGATMGPNIASQGARGLVDNLWISCVIPVDNPIYG